MGYTVTLNNVNVNK